MEWLRPVLHAEGPFVSVCLDATHNDPAGAHEVDLRWAAHEERLRAQGAPAEAVDAAHEAVMSPTGRGGRLGRLVICSGTDVVLDLVLPEPPPREEAHFCRLPHLLPAARAFCGVSHAVVDVNRRGADVEVLGALGEPVDHEQVEGDHDVLHKVPGGGWSQRRYQARVEDSWERNAATVARALDHVVRAHGPELVVVRGDDKAVAALLEHVGGAVRERVVTIDGGGRAAGGDEQVRKDEVRRVVQEHADRSRADVVGRFVGGESRQDTAVQGLSDVVDVLRRGQVDELLLRDDPTSTLKLWVGHAPGTVAETREELAAMGEDDPQQVRADTALVWALLSTDGGLTLLADDDPDITGGVGALLRWSDASTPHDLVPSMPGHGGPPAV